MLAALAQLIQAQSSAHTQHSTCILSIIASTRTTHLMPPDKVLSQAVWVVGGVRCYALLAQVAADSLVVDDGPVLAHGTIEQCRAAGLHLNLCCVCLCLCVQGGRGMHWSKCAKSVV